MDVLSLSTEATYGADSKCHMFMGDATFVQCLFLRPNNLWKITVLCNIAVGGPLILSFIFSITYPVRVDQDLFKGISSQQCHLEDLKYPYPLPWSWCCRIGLCLVFLSCSEQSAQLLMLWHGVQRKMAVFTCVLLAVGLLEICESSQVGKRLEFRCLTFLFPCPSVCDVTMIAAPLLGGGSGSCCFFCREQKQVLTGCWAVERCQYLLPCLREFCKGIRLWIYPALSFPVCMSVCSMWAL